jgi:flagellar basal body-associated protein FliL
MADENTDSESQTDEAAEKKPSSVMLIAVCVATAGVAAGAGVGVRLMLGGEAASTEAAAKAAPEVEVPELEDKDLAYYPLEPITANINVPRRNRYIRAQITLAVPRSAYSKIEGQITEKQAELRNCLTIYLSALTLDDFGGKKNLNRVRAEIKDELNQLLWPNHKGLIRDVLLKEFAVQ